MRKGSFLGILFVGIGMLLSLYSLYSIFILRNITLENVSFIVLGPSLMVLGALFRYTQAMVQVEKKIGERRSGKLSTWRMRDLEYRLKKLEKEEIKGREEIKKISEREFQKFKEIADELLGHLPSPEIEKFRQSKDFEVYEKVLSQEKTPDQEKKKFIQIADHLLGKLPPEKIKQFVQEKENYSLYQKIVRWAE